MKTNLTCNVYNSEKASFTNSFSLALPGLEIERTSNLKGFKNLEGLKTLKAGTDLYWEKDKSINHTLGVVLGKKINIPLFTTF